MSVNLTKTDVNKEAICESQETELVALVKEWRGLCGYEVCGG